MNGALLPLGLLGALALSAAVRRGSRDRALPALPTLKKRTVFHVGTRTFAEKGKKKPGHSLEGEGLSVSEYPRAWIQIAQLGGHATWALTRKDGAPGVFVDALKLKKRARTEVDAALVAAGWIRSTTVYTVAWFDDELDDTVQMEFATRGDAEREVEDREIEVKERVGWAPTPALKVRYRKHFSGALTTDFAWDYALLCWLNDQGQVDGVWWNERLAPYAYSAPRGVILPSRQTEWTWRLDKPGDE